MAERDIVHIDGSLGEGGGQILRTSLALACITGKKLHIKNIRASRRNPGLQKQHLSCVRAATEVCNCKCHGDFIGSKVLDFESGPIRSGKWNFDIGSAGSATLVAQTILPVLFLAEQSSTVTITGGTHNPLAPPFDFVNECFLPAIAKAGFRASCKLERHGFYPAGGGRLTIHAEPQQQNKSSKISLCDRPTDFQISARIYTAKLPEKIYQRQNKLLRQSSLEMKDIEHIEVTDSAGPGNCAMIILENGGRKTIFTAFGQRGKPSEKVIDEVVTEAGDFINSGAAVDRFLADQLLVYMSMCKAGAFTTNRLSSHLLTNIEIIKNFLNVDFSIETAGAIHRVSCSPSSD